MISGSDPEHGSRLARRAVRCLVAAVALSVALAAPAASDDLDRLMSLLAQRQSDHVYFVEQHYVAVLDRPVESSGELFYEAPDKLEKRILKPRAESMVIDRGQLKYQIGTRRRTIAMQAYPELAAFIESIRATLAGDLPALRQLFKVEFSGSLEKWELELVPIDSKLQQIIKRVRIQGASDDLQQIEALQPDGDRSVMSIRPAQ